MDFSAPSIGSKMSPDQKKTDAEPELDTKICQLRRIVPRILK